MAKIDWKDAEGTVASVERIDGRGGPSYTVVFNYKVGGEWYGGTFWSSDEYRKGDSLAMRYDPENPEYNDLVQKENRRRWLWGIGIAAAVVIWLLCALS